MLLKSKLTSTLQSMALFLANKDTEYILFKPVKVSSLSSCDHFRRRPNTAEEYPSKATRTPHLPSFNFDRFLDNWICPKKIRRPVLFFTLSAFSDDKQGSLLEALYWQLVNVV